MPPTDEDQEPVDDLGGHIDCPEQLELYEAWKNGAGLDSLLLLSPTGDDAPSLASRCLAIYKQTPDDGGDAAGRWLSVGALIGALLDRKCAPGDIGEIVDVSDALLQQARISREKNVACFRSYRLLNLPESRRVHILTLPMTMMPDAASDVAAAASIHPSLQPLQPRYMTEKK